jgi:putative Mg2+ transporter-C (MgtC) family protein
MPDAFVFTPPDLVRIAAVGGRLLAAGLLGGLIGAQRERVHSAAGFRTHILVALGSALIVVAGREAGFSSADTSRVVQGVVAGIGFLGAGTILKLADRGEVHGLTTAATIWVTAAVGVAAALSQLWLATVAAVLTWAVLALAVRFESRRVNGGPGGRSLS